MRSNEEKQDIAWMTRRLDDNEEDLARFRQEVGARGGNPFGLPPFDLSVEPGLANVGETVRLELTVAPGREISTDPRKSAHLVQMQADHLGPEPGPWRTIPLEWRFDGSGTGRATASVRPDRTGNWRIVWQAQDRRLVRSFAVVDGPGLVATLWVGSNRPPVDDEIHRYDLAGDTWVGDGWSPNGRPVEEALAYLAPIVRRARSYGDTLMPVVNAPFLLPGIRDTNLFHLPPEVQRRGLEQLRRLWEILRLGPLRAIASYTLGHQTVRILKELDIGVVNSLCVWQNVRDGANDNGWLINHVGMPNAPYFVADDDFRKVAPGPSGLVAFNMGTTSNVRMYDFFAYDGCATNTMPSQRYARNNAIAANADRFFTVADGWIHDAANQPGPLFVTVSLENFAGSDFWRLANREAVDHLVRRAREGRVVFAPAPAVAGYYQRHYARQPLSMFFQHDALCGLPYNAKPVRLPDRIETADHRFHALHVQGNPLPQLLWDYTVAWSNPEWDNQDGLRNAHLHVLPESIAADTAPDRSVPRQADLRGVEVQTILERMPDGLQARFMMKLPRPLARLPLALWSLPLAEITGQEERCEVLPIRDGWTGNLHALAVLEDLPQGVSERLLRLKGPSRDPRSAEFSDGTVAGRTFRPIEGVRTYLWKEPESLACRVPIDLPAGSKAFIRYNDGTEAPADAEGRIWVELDEHWTRQSPCLWGDAPIQTGGEARIGPPTPTGLMPYLRTWKISRLQKGAGDLDALTCPTALDALGLRPVRMPYVVVDLYARLRERPGDTLLYSVAQLHCDREIEGEALLGYDGPIKIWIDRALFHHDRESFGPMVMDALRVPVRLAAGDHELIVALGSGQGRTSGFTLRFRELRADRCQAPSPP